MLPPTTASPAQVHVPDLAPPRAEVLVAAGTAARLAAGLALLMGASLLVVVVALGRVAIAPVVLPVTWAVAAGLAALAAFISRRRWSPSSLGRQASWAILFAGIALAGPLFLHELVVAWRWALFFGSRTTPFIEWAGWSFVLVGHSHVLAASLLAIRGWRSSGDEPRRGPRLGVIWLVVSLVPLINCFPFGLAGVLPTLYVAVTAVPLLLLVRRLERFRERAPS